MLPSVESALRPIPGCNMLLPLGAFRGRFFAVLSVKSFYSRLLEHFRLSSEVWRDTIKINNCPRNLFILMNFHIHVVNIVLFVADFNRVFNWTEVLLSLCLLCCIFLFSFSQPPYVGCFFCPIYFFKKKMFLQSDTAVLWILHMGLYIFLFLCFCFLKPSAKFCISPHQV